MGSRQSLLEDLHRYRLTCPEAESATLARYLAFVERTPECCQRTHMQGHCTGSAFISCPRGESVLLLFHPFLQRWLQPGGHADGDFDLLRVARREAEEETGLTQLLPYSVHSTQRTPFDLDIHEIPARIAEPAHLHYDLRFLFVAYPNAPLTPETPSLQLTWLKLDEVEKATREQSVLRMVDKLRKLTRTEDGRLANLNRARNF